MNELHKFMFIWGGGGMPQPPPEPPDDDESGIYVGDTVLSAGADEDDTITAGQ